MDAIAFARLVFLVLRGLCVTQSPSITRAGSIPLGSRPLPGSTIGNHDSV
jgi:hypothetical protein